jgi:predicted transcriptional regulator
MRKKIMTRQLAVSVSDDTWNKISKLTDEEEISISSWIREAIEKYLDYENNSTKE